MGLPSEHTDWVREYEQHERDFNALHHNDTNERIPP
jgi:hypothetical protein